MQNSKMLELLSQQGRSPAFQIWCISTIVRSLTSLHYKLGKAGGQSKKVLESVLKKLVLIRKASNMEYSEITSEVRGRAKWGK